MILYRLTTIKYSDELSGEGAKIYGGRWNPVGLAALYLSEFISLSILEILVRANKSTAPDTYTLLTLQFPENSFTNIDLSSLKVNWQHHIEYTRYIGEEFLKDGKKLALRVPSAIVPQEHNFLINPVHKDFKNIKILKTELLNLDKRLML